MSMFCVYLQGANEHENEYSGCTSAVMGVGSYYRYPIALPVYRLGRQGFGSISH